MPTWKYSIIDRHFKTAPKQMVLGTASLTPHPQQRLPPGEFNSVIPEPLLVSFMMIAVKEHGYKQAL